MNPCALSKDLTEQAWVAALHRDVWALPSGMCSANGSEVSQRFAVHRNNVLSACVQALVDTFPVTQSVVGNDFFKAMGLAFAKQHLPRSRRMAFYGEGFAEFVNHFPPAQSLPYLSDLAGLEMARVRAYHAADAPDDLPGSALTQLYAALIQPEHLHRLRFTLQPSLSLIDSAWAVVSLWQAHQQDTGQRDDLLAALSMDRAEGVAVFRLDDAVLCVPLTLADLCSLRHLHADRSLGQALEMASSTARNLDLPAPDMQQILSLLVQHQLITHLNDTPTFGEMT
jgi:hypothetical protein